MKNRLSLTVGTLFFWCVCSIKAGMTWEEWTPENGIVDGQAALQEMLEAGKMPDENWQEKALAFINAFEKLKLQLQFFWRSQVGDVGISVDPWNGIPDGYMVWKRKGYIKRDCPIVLHFWLNGHIGKYTPGFGIYLFEGCFPKSTVFSESQQKKIKGNLRKHIYNIFSKKDLKKCALFLNQKFCRPVSSLINNTIEILKRQDVLQKQELEILFKLYGVYDCMDFEYPTCAQENYNNTTNGICTFVSDCCYDMSKLDPECKKWLIDLFKNYKESPYKEENVGIGRYNLNLTNILQRIISKQKMTPKVLDEEFVRVMNIVIEEWQQWLKEIDATEKQNASLMAWFQVTNALHNALYN